MSQKPLFRDDAPPAPKREPEQAARREQAEKAGKIVEVALEIVEAVIDLLA